MSVPASSRVAYDVDNQLSNNFGRRRRRKVVSTARSLPGYLHKGALPPGLITTKYIDENTNLKKQILDNTEAQREIAENKAAMNKRIRDYIDNSANKCPVSQLRNMRDQLPNLKADELKFQLTNNFYDPLLMKSMMCLSNSIVHLQQQRSGTLAANERVRYWISSLNQIGADSVEGYAMTGDLKDPNDIFIIKAPRPPADLSRELFIGLHTNKLRSIVPNFMYTYGGVSCSPPMIDSDTKNVVAWCNNEIKNVQYIFYENITPAIEMKKFVETCTFPEFLNQYIQALYALAVAYDELKFTHYDLHDQNLLLRTFNNLPEGNYLYVPYPTESGGIEYIKTNMIPTFIDPGFAHIEVDGEHYGSWDFMAYGIFPNTGFPMADAYKLLLMSMRTMLDSKNNDCFDGAVKILRFFTLESAVYVVQNQSKSYYYLPMNEETKSRSFFDLTSYIREQYPTEISDIIFSERPSDKRILGCSGTDICYTNNNGILTTLGMTDFIGANTTTELYDLIPRLNYQGRQSESDEVIKAFNYLDAKEDDNELIEELLNKLYSINLNITTINGLHIRNLMDINLIDRYKNQVETASLMFDLYQQLNMLYVIGIYVATLYNDNDTLSKRNYGKEELTKSFRQFYDPIYKSFLTDNQYLKNLAETQKTAVEFAFKTEREIQWWWGGFPIYFDVTAIIYNNIA